MACRKWKHQHSGIKNQILFKAGMQKCVPAFLYRFFPQISSVTGGEENEKSKKPIDPCGSHGVCNPLRYGRSD